MFHSHSHGCRERRFARGESGWSGRGFGHGRHGGGRYGRVFDQGDLRFVMLELIAAKPSHGYELIKAIEDKLGGAYSPSPGIVYPTLTMLEELGYTEVHEQDGKKQYAITEAGRAFLEANRAQVDAIMARIAAVGAAAGGGPAPALVRAMENLKLAVRLRLSRGPLSEDQVRAIAAALDAAANGVERA